MKVVSLNLSTLGSGKNAPIDKTNLANVKWSINWKEIMGEYYNTNKLCRVKCKLVSASSTLLNAVNNLGTIRASFSSYYSNINNGLILGIPIITQSADISTSITQFVGSITNTHLLVNYFGYGQSISFIGGTGGVSSSVLTLATATAIPIGSVISGNGIFGYCVLINQLTNTTYTMSNAQIIPTGTPIISALPNNVCLPISSLITGNGIASGTTITAQFGPFSYTVSPTQTITSIPMLSNPITEYLELDTLGTNGVTISSPVNNDFNIMFLRPDERTLMSNIPEYTILFSFEFDDDKL